MAIDSVTILRTSTGRPTAKQIGSREKTTAHRKWYHETSDVSSLDDLEALLRRLAVTKNSAIVREGVVDGAPDTILRSQSGGHLYPTPRRWLVVDLDGWPSPVDVEIAPEEAVRAARASLPDGLCDAECVVMLSRGSRGTTLSAHFWFWLGAKVESADLLRWAKPLPYIDDAVYRPSQYVIPCLPRPPADGRGDPLYERRIWRLEGSPAVLRELVGSRADAHAELARQIRAVETRTVEGAWHATLLAATHRLAGYVAMGALEEDEVVRHLTAAEQASRHPTEDAKKASDEIRRLLVGAVSRGATPIRPLEVGDHHDIVTTYLDIREDPLAYAWASWWSYSRGAWTQIPEAALALEVRERMARWPVLTKEDCKPLAWSDATTRGVLAMLRETCDRPDLFEHVTPGIVLYDGFLGPDGAIVDPSPEHGCRYRLPYTLAELESAQTPRWRRFLEEVLSPEAQHVASVVYGMALLGVGSMLQTACVLLGPGNDGKSVMLHALRAAAPEGSVSSVSLASLAQDQFSRAALAGCLINLVAEAPRTAMRETDNVKAVIAGDLVALKRKYKPEVQGRITCAHFFAANEMPSTDDHSLGLYRRFRVLPFRPHGNQEDPHLPAKLEAERAGIAAWGLRAALQFLASGKGTLALEGDVAEAGRAWRAEDPVQLWTDEHLLEGQERVEISTAYQRYAEWSAAHGFASMSVVTFAKRLRRALPPDRFVRTKSTRYVLASR